VICISSKIREDIPIFSYCKLGQADMSSKFLSEDILKSNTLLGGEVSETYSTIASVTEAREYPVKGEI
jgi:hypothetical protein